jgi:hypothetical protein
MIIYFILCLVRSLRLHWSLSLSLIGLLWSLSLIRLLYIIFALGFQINTRHNKNIYTFPTKGTIIEPINTCITTQYVPARKDYRIWLINHTYRTGFALFNIDKYRFNFLPHSLRFFLRSTCITEEIHITTWRTYTLVCFSRFSVWIVCCTILTREISFTHFFQLRVCWSILWLYRSNRVTSVKFFFLCVSTLISDLLVRHKIGIWSSRYTTITTIRLAIIITIRITSGTSPIIALFWFGHLTHFALLKSVGICKCTLPTIPLFQFHSYSKLSRV